MLKVTDSQGNIRDITKVIKTEEVLPEYKADRHGTEEILSSGKSVSPILSINYEGTRQEAEFTYRQTGGGTLTEDIEKAKIEKVKGNTVAWNQFLKENKLVDMGLPSGTLWASCNIDVTQEDGFAATPFQYECSFFSWGNIDGHNPINTSSFDYDWGGVNSQEPWYEGQPYGDTRGNTLIGNIPIGDIYDAARANVGSLFRMPTSAEFAELFANIIYINADGTEVDTTKADKRVIVNGVLGIYIESNINGARLFFSCSGNGNGRTWRNRGLNGYYWSSTFHTTRFARLLFIYNTGVYPQYYYGDRFCGYALRPVLTKKLTSDTGGKGHKFILSSNNKNIIDATLVYNAGNEPTTVTQFEADYQRWFGKPLTYEEYDAGSLRPVLMNAIQTKGANDSWTKTQNLPTTTLTGKLNGAGSSVTIFPDGMKKAGSVYDEIKIDNGVVKAVKRIGSLDLGGLNWVKDAWPRLTASLPSYVYVQPLSDVPNAIIAFYNAVKASLNFSSLNKVFTIASRTGLVVADTSYTDATTFKAAMQGVMLYYELATPEEYVLDIPMKEISVINHTDSNGNIRQVLVGN